MIMSQPPPRKKARVQREDLGAPLPVPVTSLTGFATTPANWHYYRAEYDGECVCVTDHHHANALWRNGYYGHGLQDQDNTDENFEEKTPRRKNWKLLKTNQLQGSDFFKDYIHVGHASNSSGDGRGNSDCLDNGNTKDPSEKYNPFENEHEDDVNLHHVSSEQYDPFENDQEQKEKTDGEDRLNDINDDTAEVSTVLDLDSYRSGHNNDPSYGVAMKLSLEEAMFLSYALGCLVVTNKVENESYHMRGNREMSIDDMWRAFTLNDKTFPIKYFVYHHYRTKGWVVKSGLKFGADFVLYPVGPPVYHSQYTVMVQCVWGDTLQRDTSLAWRGLSWTNVAAMERLNSHVAKAPVMVFVVRPRGLTANQLLRVDCLAHLTLRAVHVSRWLPTTHTPQDE